MRLVDKVEASVTGQLTHGQFAQKNDEMKLKKLNLT